MKKAERVLGIVYIPVHAVVLPILIAVICAIAGIELSGPYQMLLYYTIAFVLVFAMMFRFLRSSFSDFIGNFWLSVQALILGYVFYRFMLWVAALIMDWFVSGNDPNSEAIISDIVENFKVMLVVTSILAPIVEETVFRGALFGTIRQKNRTLAYIVSIVVFSLFHLWDSLLFDFSWNTLLHIVYYVPPSIALAWSYERSGTIWTPILLHSIMNLLTSIQVR